MITIKAPFVSRGRTTLTWLHGKACRVAMGPPFRFNRLYSPTVDVPLFSWGGPPVFLDIGGGSRGERETIQGRPLRHGLGKVASFANHWTAQTWPNPNPFFFCPFCRTGDFGFGGSVRTYPHLVHILSQKKGVYEGSATERSLMSWVDISGLVLAIPGRKDHVFIRMEVSHGKGKSQFYSQGYPILTILIQYSAR